LSSTILNAGAAVVEYHQYISFKKHAVTSPGFGMEGALCGQG